MSPYFTQHVAVITQLTHQARKIYDTPSGVTNSKYFKNTLQFTFKQT